MIETLDIPLYKGDITICVFTNLKYSVEKCGFKYNGEMNHYESFLVRTEEMKYFMFIPPTISHGVVASTARRLCKLIYEGERIKICSAQIQHECRLLEWIVDKTYLVLNDTKIKTVYAEN